MTPREPQSANEKRASTPRWERPVRRWSPSRSIRRRLIAGGVLTLCLPLALFAAVTGTILWRFYLRELEAELTANAQVIAEDVAATLSSVAPTDEEERRVSLAIVGRWRRHTRLRVTVVGARATVLAASTGGGEGEPVDEARRPGLRRALEGHTNGTIWKSPNFDFEDTMYVNVPARRAGRVVGAVRVAHSLAEIQQKVARVRSTLLAASALYGAVLVFLVVAFARSVVQPIETLQRDATRIAAGDLSLRVGVQGRDEIAALAATINQMTARLQLLEGLRRQYVSDVSHELRTPLTAIRSMAETLLAYGDSDPALRERYLPRIVGQTDRLARLATQLLDLAQIESGNLVGSFAPVALEGVLDEIAATFGPQAQARSVDLALDVPGALPHVRGDRDRLVQVFVNLVDNALRHTPAGGRVTVRATAERDRVLVTVEDSGEGVAAEHLPHLFERFYRAQKSRSPQSGGAGLGLAIVRQVVEAHGGRIDVESVVGEGTRFRLALPCAEPAAPREASHPRPSYEP